MESAFGVDHGGIAKSYVNGVFKPAKALTAAERKMVGGYKKAKGVSDADRTFKIQRQVSQAISDNTPKKPAYAQGSMVRNGRKINWRLAKPGPGEKGYAGGTTARGGRKGTANINLNAKEHKTHSAVDATLAHELAHATPKRSAYRLHHQIASDPSKLYREEARADMAGGSYWRNAKHPHDSGYIQEARLTAHKGPLSNLMDAQSKAAHEAFRTTQDKIATAHRRKRMGQ